MVLHSWESRSPPNLENPHLNKMGVFLWGNAKFALSLRKTPRSFDEIERVTLKSCGGDKESFIRGAV